MDMGKIAGGHSTYASRIIRTINCRCAYPTVTNRLHGDREKDPKY
jgi:hypothetical protein